VRTLPGLFMFKRTREFLTKVWCVLRSGRVAVYSSWPRVNYTEIKYNGKVLYRGSREKMPPELEKWLQEQEEWLQKFQAKMKEIGW